MHPEVSDLLRYIQRRNERRKAIWKMVCQSYHHFSAPFLHGASMGTLVWSIYDSAKTINRLHLKDGCAKWVQGVTSSELRDTLEWAIRNGWLIPFTTQYGQRAYKMRYSVH